MLEKDRLTRLEERYTHLHEHVLEQDKVMLALSEELDRLRKYLATLREQTGPNDGDSADQIDQPPPHY